jgi:hypothetical protein
VQNPFTKFQMARDENCELNLTRLSERPQAGDQFVPEFQQSTPGTFMAK